MRITARRLIIYCAAGAAIVLIAWLSLFRNRSDNVETMTVAPKEFLQQISVTGTLVAAQTSALGFFQSGRITSVNVQAGDQVATGTVLASLDNGSLQAQLAQQLSYLSQQREELGIIENGGSSLFLGGTFGNLGNESTAGGGNIISPNNNTASKQAEIAAQKDVISAAAAAVASAQAELNQTLVTAPFSGTITRVDAKVGQITSPDTPEIFINSNGPFQIQSNVPELDIPGVKIGDPAIITTDAYGSGAAFAATVIAIDSSETLVGTVPTYKVTLQLNKTDPRLKSGMTANVLITTESKPNELVVPEGVIFTMNNKNYVQVRSAGKLIDQEVKVGLVSNAGQAEILAGLKNGDVIVLNPLSADK